MPRTETLALPRSTWDSFLAQFSREWQPGEHVFIYGETGSGKTELAFKLLNTRPFGVAFITKPRDPIFTSPLTRGYRKVNAWPPKSVDSITNSHFLLSPKTEKRLSDEVKAQRDLFPQAFDDIYTDGGWSVLFDETLHLANTLAMRSHLSNFAYMARSNALTGVYCTQQPKNIPTVIPQSCRYAFIARIRRRDHLKTLSELGYSADELERELNRLRSQHDFLFVDPQGRIPLQIVNTHA